VRSIWDNEHQRGIDYYRERGAPMSGDPNHNLSDTLDGRINDRGFFERILSEREKVDAERDRRLDERFEGQDKAVAAALAAQEKATDAAFAASKEAVAKAEASARETMKSHNDLIRQSRDRDETYATQMDLAHTNENVKKIEGSQGRLVGGLFVAGFVAPTISGLVVYALTH
jgi:hypothetical protein